MHSAFWVMHRLWGDATLGYHLVNIVLHATSAWLLLRVLRRLAVPGALFAAFLFALHPVQVESVAWISELKNTLSTLFYLLAALAYLRFDETRRPAAWVTTAAWFIAGLLTKTVVATLPFSLVVVLWWRRGSLTWRKDLRPLLPLLVLGIAGGLTTAWVERTYIGATGSEFEFSAIERLLIAGRAVCFYAAQLVWPANLMFTYPRWTVSQAVWWQFLFPASVAAVMFLCWRLRDRTRGPLTALLLYGIALGPALGFVNIYPFIYSFVADHFQYTATLAGLAFLAAVATTFATATSHRHGSGRDCRRGAGATRGVDLAAQPSVRERRNAVSKHDRAQSVRVDGLSESGRHDARHCRRRHRGGCVAHSRIAAAEGGQWRRAQQPRLLLPASWRPSRCAPGI